MRTGDLLRAAAGEVRKGWCQYFVYQGQKACALGAIHRSAASMNDRQEAEQSLATLLPCSIAQWNDRSDQTQENVALMLEFAALVWDQQQTVKAENAAIEVPA